MASPDDLGLSGDDLAHVAGPPVGVAVRLSDGVSTDAHVDGPPDGEVVVLIAGLGQQRIVWPPELLARLHAAGLRTVTADNRDVGRGPVHREVSAGAAAGRGRDAGGGPGAAYPLARMAADHLEVLDHLGMGRAHVLGMSMGGMIAQHVALAAPARTISLVSVMSTTGARDVGRPTERAKPALTSVPPDDDADAYVAYQVELQATIGSPEHREPGRVAARSRVAFARGVHPGGSARQQTAIADDGDRTARLAGLRVPTLVLHGEDDPLIDVSGGEATAAAIDGARLVTVPGWGHDLPVGLLDRIVPPLLEHLDASSRTERSGR